MENSINMDAEQEVNLKMQCIDYATRIVGKPQYLNVAGQQVKEQEDVVKVAERIYKFVTKSQ